MSKNLLDLLQKSSHPEDIHRRMGTHPGTGWWLKTICPNPHVVKYDIDSLGLQWYNYSRRQNHLVRLVGQAWDWQGNRIPWTFSVWLHQNIDSVILNEQEPRIVLIERHIGEQTTIKELREILNANEMLDFKASLEVLKSMNQERLSKEIRKTFKVIRNDEENSTNSK